MNLSENDIVLCTIHENTKNERETIAQIKDAGVSMWLEGPEISTTISNPEKVKLLIKGSKKVNKLFKKFSEKVEKFDIDDIGFEQYQESVKDIVKTYIEKFREVEQNG